MVCRGVPEQLRWPRAVDPESGPIDPHRPGNVLQLLITEVIEPCVDLVPHLAICVFGNTDAARFGDSFKTSSNVRSKFMTRIVLVRHGHVEGIKPERFRGRAPLQLTARGRAEAAAVAKRIAGHWQLSAVYTSPMRRCVETAEAVADACAVTVRICDDLNDLDYGAWQLKPFADAEAEDQALFAAWFAAPHLVRFPGGESLQDIAARAANALRLLLERHPEDAIVLVGHDSVNCVLLLEFLGLPLASYWRIEQGPCCVNEINIARDRNCVLRINETHHLEGISV